MTPLPLSIAYITGIGHSGSTLLDLLISAHSAAVSVGEIINVDDYASLSRAKTPATPLGNECTCGAATIFQCDFWRAVDTYLRDHFELDLKSLRVNSRDTQVFNRHNEALFRAAAAIGRASLVVDSSKSAARMARLAAIDGLNVLPIYLHRSELGVVNSKRKKGDGLLGASLRVVAQTVGIWRVVRKFNLIYVEYLELTERTDDVISEVMKRLGFEFESRQLQWATQEKHLIGGNRMRRSKSNTVRADTAWQSSLNGLQRSMVSALTAPASILVRDCRRRDSGAPH